MTSELWASLAKLITTLCLGINAGCRSIAYSGAGDVFSFSDFREGGAHAYQLPFDPVAPGCRVPGVSTVVADRSVDGVRIVGGKFKGRDLTSPNDFRVRPTAEVVRAWLLDQLAVDVKGARVLDLFAGTGALGLEALSRGARSADFVETRPSSLHALKANIALLRMLRLTRVFKRDALPFAGALEAASYDVTFVDPPYGSKMLDRVIDSWQAKGFSRILAVEHAKAHTLPKGAVRQSFDDTSVTIYKL